MATTVYPSLEKALFMLKKVESDDMNVRKTKELFTLLRKIPIVNLRISGHILTRNTAVSSYGWTIDSLNGDEIKAREAKIRLKGVIDKLVNSHALTHIYGHQVYKLRWVLTTSGQTPVIAESYYHDYECHNSVFYQVSGNNQKSILNKNFNLLLDSTENYETNGGLMRAALLTELLRFDAMKEQSNFIKKLKGILQIINKGGEGEEQQAAETAARTAIQDNFLITSDLIEFRLNQITSNQTPFRDILNEFNNDIAIGFLGQANTAQLPNNGGSRAALNVMRLISADIAYSDIIHVNEFINSQLIKYDAELNYEEKEPSYQFRVLDDADIDRENGAITAKACLDTGLPFLKSEIYAIQNMTVPKPGDDVIQFERVI